MALTKVSPSMIDVSLLVDAILPAGIMLDWPGVDLPPGRWLWCDGSEVSRTGETAALFAVCGIRSGAGDDSTTFNVPDYRGRVSAGSDDMGGNSAGRLTGGSLGSVLGVESVTLSAAQSGLPGHTHTATSSHTLATGSAGAHVHTYDKVSETTGDGLALDAVDGVILESDDTGSAVAHTHPITGGITTTVTAVAAAPASEQHTNVQPTLVCNKIIKY